MFSLFPSTILSAFDAPFELSADGETAVAVNDSGLAELYVAATEGGSFAVIFNFEGSDGDTNKLLFRCSLRTCYTHAGARVFLRDFVAGHNARSGYPADFQYEEI